MQTLVLVAHPQLEHSRVTRRLMRRAAALGGGVEVRDLYALYPDYWVDVPAEQALLAEADRLVWLQPIHWYGMPPLLKLWLDEVFAFGWAYGPGGHALCGKQLWLVASTGGPAASYRPEGYNRRRFDEFLAPYEQTADLAGMHWLPPLLLHGAHQAPEADVQTHEDRFIERLAELQAAGAGTFRPAAEVPADARPADRGSP